MSRCSLFLLLALSPLVACSSGSGPARGGVASTRPDPAFSAGASSGTLVVGDAIGSAAFRSEVVAGELATVPIEAN